MRILAFFAHPDDETILIGGTLALLSRLGADVHYLCATRGEGGELGDPPVGLRDEIGRLREQELTCAVKALGGKSLEFLGYVDPLVGPNDELYAFATDLPEVVAKLAAVAHDLQIDALITHGSNGEYGHPAHRLVYQAAADWVRLLGPDAPLWYTVMAAYPDHPRPRSVNPDDPADFIIDVTPTLEQKTQAAFCHASQNALFVRRRSEEAGRRMTVPEVMLSEESLHRVWPPSDDLLMDPLAELLVRSGQLLSR
ncbi:MAG TPA: PIG-L deacetylase family protein [Anaerolineaceae bacterium]|nr:PIG-L deacetylase family protein [Anaerolineaceae bacterium]